MHTACVYAVSFDLYLTVYLTTLFPVFTLGAALCLLEMHPLF